MKRFAVLGALGTLALAGAVTAAPGITTLPTGWRIRGPEGPVATVGTLPSGIVVSSDGSQVVELEAGYGNRTLRVLDASSLRQVRAVKLNGAFGAPLRDRDGSGVWVDVAGDFQEQIAHVDVARGIVDRDVTLPVPFYPVAIARSPRDGTLAVAGDLANRVALVDPAGERVVATVDVGRHPAALLYSADGNTLYVADRGEADLDVVDVAAGRVRARIRVGLHPVALASDGRRLFVVDFRRRRRRRRRPRCAARDPARANPVPAIAVDRKHGALYVADGKGESGHPNPQYGPFVDHSAGYVATQLVGSVRRIAIPSDAALRAGLDDVRELAEHEPAPPSAVVRAGGPIRHVIYVIKENHSYDEVLRDLAQADGDPSLVLFGENVTPNQHALARRFGIFDRFLEDAHVSADGHNWSTAAFANDYLEKMWPQNYSSRRPFYDFEDGAEASVPHDGYLWDDAAHHGVTVRNYGEFVAAGPSKPTPVSVGSDVLRPRTDRDYPTFDLEVHDSTTRFAEWKREFDRYEATRTLPQLEIVRFPQDHTSGTRAGAWTP